MVSARRSAAKWWFTMGILMIAFACCRATAATGDDEMMSRQRRGLVLRSWRGAQHQQSDHSDERSALPKVVDPILPPSRDAMVLAGLPISMKLVLLQRLTGYDKRTPNSKAFLGMRGKKNSIWSDEDDLLDEYNAPDSSGSSESEDMDADANTLRGVPEKKKIHGERFVGMRGKKMVDAAASQGGQPILRERFFYQQPMVDVMGRKRAPSSHSFMGMRGKRSSPVTRLEDEQDNSAARYEERQTN